MRDRRALISPHIAHARLQQRLGDGDDALAAEGLAGAEPERFDLVLEGTFHDSILALPHPYPQTSRAVSATSRSLAACSAIDRSLPSRVEEKPHCGERQSCSKGAYLAAWSMRRFRSSFDSSSPFLVVTRPSTTTLPLGRKRSGAKEPERSSSYSRKNPSTFNSLNSA